MLHLADNKRHANLNNDLVPAATDTRAGLSDLKILSLEEWTVFSYNLNISTYIALFPRVPNTHLFPPLLKEKFIFRLISSIMLLTNPTVSVSPDFPGYSFTGGCFFSDFPGTIIC